MDPLTLTTGILALLRACVSLSETLIKIKNLKDGPLLIQAINNEVSDLRLVLTHIDEYLEHTKIKESAQPALDAPIYDLCSSTLEQTRDKVQKAEALLEGKLLKPRKEADSEKGPRISYKAFLRERHHLNQLQADLRLARQRIANIFGPLGVRDISRIEVLLNDIRSNNLSALLRSQARIEETLDRVVDLRSGPSNAVHQASQDATPPCQGGSNPSGVQLSIARQHPLALSSKCACRPQRTSVQLRTVLGNLFLGYAATPLRGHWQQKCSYHKKIKLQLVYFFPIWFLKYAIFLYSEFSAAGSVAVSLSIKQVLPSDHIVWDLLAFGNIDGLKELLVSGQISIEAQSVSGDTLLDQSLLMGNRRSIKFLVQLGANRFLGGPSLNGSAQKTAWNRILTKDLPPDFTEEMKSLFPDPDFEELYGFSSLHKAVLGLNSCSVEDAIRALSNQIDQTDNSGRTALSWAVTGKSSQATQALLLQGANPNLADDRGRSPLSWAARNSWECTNLLLKAGADVHSKNKFTTTALHMAASSTNFPEAQHISLLEALMQAGANVNAITSEGATPLILMSATNHTATRAIYCLIENGADPEICDVNGRNALCIATMENHHSLIDLLLQKYQDHTKKLETYGSFMHLAAEFASAESLRLLARGNLERRDTNTKNRAGITPTQLAIQRKNIDAEWRHAWFDFLRSIDRDIPQPESPSEPLMASQELGIRSLDSGASSSISSDDDESEDDFEDAVEVQA